VSSREDLSEDISGSLFLVSRMPSTYATRNTTKSTSFFAKGGIVIFRVDISSFEKN